MYRAKEGQMGEPLVVVEDENGSAVIGRFESMGIAERVATILENNLYLGEARNYLQDRPYY